MPSRKKGRGFQPSVGGGGGWPFSGRQPPSGPRGFGGGPLLPLGEVDLEKVKREVAEAREQVEDAVKAQQARDLLAYMARGPMHVSESAWFAVKGDWVPAEGLKRRLDEVEDKERKLKVKEISADLQKQAAEEEKKDKEKEAVLYKEIVHFLRVWQWQAGDLSEAEKARRSQERRPMRYTGRNWKGFPFTCSPRRP
jgi:hypothetical protein